MGAFDNATDFKTFIEASNVVSGNYLVYAIPITIFIVLLFANFKHGRSRAITVASYATFFVVLFLNTVGLMPYYLVMASLMLLALGTFGVLVGKQVFGS